MNTTSVAGGPIGIFDSGYGGLTILREIRSLLPGYDYLYLGDNARAPYGTRSFDVVYRYTLQAVTHLLRSGCPLVILACNTASAKALRSIQQNDLPRLAPDSRVLGVIRPTAEIIGHLTSTRHVGVLGTPGTIASRSYDIEIAKLHPDITVHSQACPMWVPLIENDEAASPGADYFVDKYIGQLLQQSPLTDTIILGCTHYPLLYDKIRARVPAAINVMMQGSVVASSLADYLRRHPEIDRRLSRGASCSYLTTEDPDKFANQARIFLRTPLSARHIDL